jgi:hypothetical protein
VKKYICIAVNHHKDISWKIEEQLKDGWHLHTYQATGTPTAVNHYLLFEKEE